jgi:hypothetical protein
VLDYDLTHFFLQHLLHTSCQICIHRISTSFIFRFSTPRGISKIRTTSAEETRLSNYRRKTITKSPSNRPQRPQWVVPQGFGGVFCSAVKHLLPTTVVQTNDSVNCSFIHLRRAFIATHHVFPMHPLNCLTVFLISSIGCLFNRTVPVNRSQYCFFPFLLVPRGGGGIWKSIT